MQIYKMQLPALTTVSGFRLLCYQSFRNGRYKMNKKLGASLFSSPKGWQITVFLNSWTAETVTVEREKERTNLATEAQEICEGIRIFTRKSPQKFLMPKFFSAVAYLINVNYSEFLFRTYILWFLIQKYRHQNVDATWNLHWCHSGNCHQRKFC